MQQREEMYQREEMSRVIQRDDCLDSEVFGQSRAEGSPEVPVELWAGIECTVNRVGDDYFDQLALNGHDCRVEDLDLFASLGAKAIRYPVLWERTAPEGLERADWSWPDERLGRLRQLGLRPIVGLLHHGSGPWHTSLMEASL